MFSFVSCEIRENKKTNMLPFETTNIFEQLPRFVFKMPRVVPDQESKFQSDELFRRLCRESEVSCLEVFFPCTCNTLFTLRIESCSVTVCSNLFYRNVLSSYDAYVSNVLSFLNNSCMSGGIF